MGNASFMQLALYSWAAPIVHYANKHGTIRPSSLGNIHQAMKCDNEAEKIKKAWLIKKKNGNPDHSLLLSSIVSCFFSTYLYYVFWQVIWTGFTLLNPYFISFMVTYFATGENYLAKYGIHFIDFSKSDIPFLKWFTDGKQYAFGICIIFLTLTLFQKVLKRKIDVSNSFFADRAKHGLIYLIFEKQFVRYTSGGEDYNQGDMINLVQ